MKTILTNILLFVAAATSWAQIPFDMPEVARPQIPSYTVKITDFNAKGDGSALCTKAFEAAFNNLKSHGGGHIIVPAGIWLTGPIVFESNCDLHVEQGALVLFTTDYDEYPDITTIYEGNTSKRKMSPLYAKDKHDISITGPGTFDGQGQAWRPAKRGKFTDAQWQELTKSGGIVEKNVFYPDAYPGHKGAEEGKLDPRRVLNRPVLLDFHNCKRIMLQDATFCNSANWNIHPLKCEDVTIERCQIRNPWYAQNGDGLDLESCTRAQILKTTFDVGDDAICIKSGKNAEGRSWNMPCQKVRIEDCTVLHGHGGFVIGSEMSSGVKDVYVNNCLFNGTDTGLRMKSTRGRGGVVENIHINNIYMTNIAGDAFTFDLYYGNKPVMGNADADSSPKDAIPAVTEETPSFRNLHIQNVICQGAARAVYFNGLPEMPLTNLTMKNSLFTSKKGVEMHYAKDITFENVTINNSEGEKFNVTADVKNFVNK